LRKTTTGSIGTTYKKAALAAAADVIRTL